MKIIPFMVAVTILTLSLLPPAGAAGMYEWIDDNGIVHFSDDPDKIPEKYMKRVKERDSVKGEPGKTPDAQPPQRMSPPSAKTRGGGSSFYGGYGEGYWRSAFYTLRSDIKKQEALLAAKRDSLNTLRRKRLIYKRARDRGAYNELDKEINQDIAALNTLRTKLAILEAEAEAASVPVEWRQ